MQMGMHGQSRLPPAPRNKFSVAKSALEGREVDESFQKAILDTMIVYPVCRLEIRRFVLDSIAQIRKGNGCHYDPSVPISVSKPFSSSKGME